MGWFYFLTAYILFVAIVTNAIKSKERKNKVTVLLGFGMLAFFAMFHSDSVGSDIKTYLYAFEIANSSIGISNTFGGYEIGFIWLVKILSYISDNPQVLIISIGAFAYFSYSRFVLKYSKIPWLSLYLFFTLGYFDFSLSGLRQVISTAILLFAYDFVIQKKPVKFMCVVLLASLFHNAAWAFLFAYFISKVKSKKKYLNFITISSIIVGIMFNKVFSILLQIFPKYSYYVGGRTTDGVTRIATILKILVLILMVLMELFSEYKDKDKVKDSIEKRINHINFLYVITAIAILISSTNATAISRSAQIYNICSIIYLPNVISNFKNRRDKALVISFAICLFFLYILVIQIFRTPEWQITYPFSFFWE